MRAGFIGIGNMGWPMAANLVAAGHAVSVHDADPGRAARFAAETGARAAASLAELGDCAVTITMLPTGAIVRQVLLEDEGGAFAAALRPGTVIVDMSSSEPVGTQELGALLSARGAVLLDAPVSGGVARARTGELAIMIGGDDPAAIATVEPLLSAMGGRLFRTGALGSGHAMKALNNYVAAAAYLATAEAMLVGRRFGLDPGTMVDIMNVSTGRNFHTDMVMNQHVVSGTYATGFAIGLLAKDVRIAAELGRQMRLDAPLSRLVAESWTAASAALGADADNSAAITAMERDLPD